MNIEQSIKLGLTALKKTLGSKFRKERIDIATITKDGYKKLKREEIEKYLKK